MVQIIFSSWGHKGTANLNLKRTCLQNSQGSFDLKRKGRLVRQSEVPPTHWRWNEVKQWQEALSGPPGVLGVRQLLVGELCAGCLLFPPHSVCTRLTFTLLLILQFSVNSDFWFFIYLSFSHLVNGVLVLGRVDGWEPFYKWNNNMFAYQMRQRVWKNFVKYKAVHKCISLPFLYLTCVRAIIWQVIMKSIVKEGKGNIYSFLSQD